MTAGSRRDEGARWRRIAAWLLLGLGCWGAARLTERQTRVEIFSSRSRVEASAGGSSISAPLTVESIRRIEIVATASPFPPGGRRLVVSQGSSRVLVDRLPARFDLPPGAAPPTGDWEIDERAGTGVAYSRAVSVEGPFDLKAIFTGRPQQHLVVQLIGTPSFAISFRRGLINSDLFLWDADWRPIAVTSIDPDPASDALAAASILLDAAAAAAGLIALFLLLARLAPGTRLEPRPRLAARAAPAIVAVVVLAATAGLTSLWFADAILQRLPHLPDSVVYLLQADWLRHGHLAGAASPIQGRLDIPFTYVSGGLWIGHYPVGWPSLLALGLALGAPWTVAPALALAYVLLLWWFGRELYGEPTALAAAALATLSPLARLLGGCFLSHAASSSAVVLALVLAARARRRASTASMAASGLVVGLTLAVRPMAAVAVALPLTLLLLDDLRRRSDDSTPLRLLAAGAVGALVGSLPVLAANLAVTGSPLAYPYSLASGSMFGLANVPFGLRNLDAILASTVPALYGWGWGSSWTWLFQSLPLAFAAVPFLLRRATRWDVVLLGVLACLAAAHLGTKAHGLHGFGPRYYFDAFAALYLLTARGFAELARVAGRRSAYPGAGRQRNLATSAGAVILLVGLCLPAAVSIPRRLELYRGYNGVDASLERAIAEADADHAVVAFSGSDWQDWAMASRFMTGQLERDLVFARAAGSLAPLRAAFPDRPIFLWGNGELQRVEDP